MCKGKNNTKKYLGNIFVSTALGFVSLVYYLYTRIPHGKSHSGHLSSLWFHSVFLLFLFSFFRCSFSEPGMVPPYWGFQMGDSESKRKRYCLMCHVFKPDRCHHCSICNRCVLNMDHHCRTLYLAWINNCIGFYNRKIFMLMLFYALLSGYTALCSILPVLFSTFQHIWKTESLNESHFFFVVWSTLLILILLIITKFTYFHIQLVLQNMTTIETLENSYNPRYSVNVYKNFVQVFGQSPALWLLPWNFDAGKPVGDGINWPMVGSLGLSSDVNVESEPNVKELTGKSQNKNVWVGERHDVRTPNESETDISFVRNNPSTSN